VHKLVTADNVFIDARLNYETEKCRVLFQNKINLRYCALVGFTIEIYYDTRFYKRETVKFCYFTHNIF